MRGTLIIFSFLLITTSGFGQKKNSTQSDSNLAMKYYRDKEFDKAIPLLSKVYKKTKSSYYYNYYINSLLETNQNEKAIRSIQTEIKRQNNNNLYVTWGYILRKQGEENEAEKKFQHALDNVPNSRGAYISLANSFNSWREYEWAKKTLLLSERKLPEVKFHNELSLVYLYLRDYEAMMDEYFELLKIDPKQLSRVQSRLRSAMRLDLDNELRNRLRRKVIKKIQNEPDQVVYNRLLIWFFLQDKEFDRALKQAIALDKRTGNEEKQIQSLAKMASKNIMYDDSKKAYEYLLENKKSSKLYTNFLIESLQLEYLALNDKSAKSETEALALNMSTTLDSLGYTLKTFGLIKSYAHLLAYNLQDYQKSIEILQKGLKIPRLNNQLRGELKSQLADVYAYTNDPWEATLLYSQVIEKNKKSSLGDDTKLKKAKLSYYMGNFDWAKAQLDVLKASTSKLTANDAMELSILISNSLNADTTGIPLKMFARADFLFFKNKNKDALATLDSLISKNVENNLVDDILYRKAKIEINSNNFKEAIQYLTEIATIFNYESLADDANFELANLYYNQLNQPKKAKEIYKEIFIEYPGSVFAEEARTKYRVLLELYPDEEKIQ